MRRWHVFLVCVFHPSLFLFAQLSRISTTNFEFPVAQLFYFPGCSDKPAVVLQKETGCRLVHGKTQLDLDSTEQVSFVTADKAYTIRKGDGKAELREYNCRRSPAELTRSKEIQLDEKGLHYFLKPLVKDSRAIGWAKLPVESDGVHATKIEMLGLNFETKFTFSETFDECRMEAISPLSFLFTAILKKNKSIEVFVLDTDGKVVKTTKLETGFRFSQVVDVIWSPAYDGVEVVLNESGLNANKSYVLAGGFTAFSNARFDFEGQIDRLAIFDNTTVIHPYVSYNEPGRRIYFISHNPFEITDTLDVENVLHDVMDKDRLQKMSFYYRIGGMFPDPKNNWLAIHVYEQDEASPEIGSNYVIVYRKGSAPVFERLSTGSKAIVLPLASNHLAIAQGMQLTIYNVN